MISRIRTGVIALVTAAAMSLTGCAGVSFTVENLLGAPKLTEEQSEIHEALIASVGSGISLRYPKNGDNRSAYVIADLDDEPGEEALVFYSYNSGGDNGIRMNLLDKNENGEWYSVKELAGAGAEVDRVVISSFTGSKRQNVLVGYQSLTSADRTLEIYSYSDGDLKRIGLDTYSLLEALDINSDGFDEVVTIQRQVNQETGLSSAKAYLLDMEGEKLVKNEGIDMCPGVTGYTGCVTGLLNHEHEAVFIDGLTPEGELMTEIVYYRYSSLQDPMQQSPEKLLPLCTRPQGYSCGDVDGDGIVEIPSTQPMTGYENAVTEEMVYMTTWKVYKDFFDLSEKYRGYYSISDGFFFAFPQRWQNLVTVRRDSETGELVFYKFTGDINTSHQELMRVAVTAKSASDDFVNDGYSLVESKGQLEYYVKLPSDRREQLVLTIDEVKNNFYIVD